MLAYLRALPKHERAVGGLWEIKVDAQRVFYVLIGGPTVVLLHAYRKQGQKAPRRELDVARERMKQVLGTR